MKKILLIFLLLMNSFIYSQWNRKSDFPLAGRAFCISFSLENKIFVGSGASLDPTYDAGGSLSGTHNSYYHDLWEYDPNTNVWNNKADYPGLGTRDMSSFSINGKGYAGLGTYKVGTATHRPSDFWMYDPITDEWVRKADFPGVRQDNMVSFSIGSKAYVGLGINLGYPTTFWVYDTDNDIWDTIASFPGIGRYAAIGFTIAGKAYVGAGGHDYDTPRDFWCYDPSLNQWDSIAPIPEGRRNGLAFVLENKAYVGTGTDEATALGSSNFWVYDPILNSWSALPDDLPCDMTEAYWVTYGSPGVAQPGRSRAISQVVNNKAYVGLGKGNCSYDDWKDFYEYSPSVVTSTNITQLGASAVSVFPNPNAHVFTVSYKLNTNMPVVMTIFDSVGKSIYEKQYGAHVQEVTESIDLSSYPAGSYTLQVISGKNKAARQIVLK